jgi:hypothetical protein
VDFGPEINCGQFVERQYSSWFMADLLVKCPRQVIYWHDGSHPPTLNSSEMAGLLNTFSCAPANLEAGDYEEIA